MWQWIGEGMSSGDYVKNTCAAGTCVEDTVRCSGSGTALNDDSCTYREGGEVKDGVCRLPSDVPDDCVIGGDDAADDDNAADDDENIPLYDTPW